MSGNQGQTYINAIVAAPRDGSTVYAVGQNQIIASGEYYSVIVRRSPAALTELDRGLYEDQRQLWGGGRQPDNTHDRLWRRG
ncbi:MAG: hypothetical protein IPK16_29480 [Anaerolineales bacterium]|nr:hypothetical protein [Anaerolineales bacterium]